MSLSPAALVDITCTLLLLNPDFTTAWNVRYSLTHSLTPPPTRAHSGCSVFD